MDNQLVTIYDAASGGAVVDLATAGVVASDKLFIAGARTSGKAFTSLKEQLLSSANSGLANHFGIEKTAYPFLQAYNKDGSGLTAATLLDGIFDTHNRARQIGKGNPTEAIMSYKLFAAVMKSIENGTGPGLAAQYQASDSKANVFGWTEIMVTGVKGALKLVAVPDMDDDVIFILDWESIKLFSNGMFERRTSPEGKQFYEIRNTSGYQYVVDVRFFGELVVSKPSSNAVICKIAI